MADLHKLVKQGDVDALAKALEGVDINATNMLERTPLHVAAMDGKADMVELLLKNEADMDAEDEDGNTPLHLASQNGHIDVVKLLLDVSDEDAENGEGHTPAWLALQEGHLEVAEAIWEAGAELSLQFDDGQTYLHKVAEGNNVEGVTALIKRGATVDPLDAYRNTPLMNALKNGSWAAARALIEAKADVKAIGKDGWTPLHFCAASGRKGAIELAELLIEKGASARARTRDGSTPAAVVGELGPKRSKPSAADEDLRDFLADAEADEDD